MDCGPTCLYMVGRYYGRAFSLEKLRELIEIGKEGVNLLGISDAAEKKYETFAIKYPMNGELEKKGEKITIMKEWREKTKIQFTPTFFIDGYQMPTEYKLTDLQYFIASEYS